MTSRGLGIDTALEFRQPCVSLLRRDMQAGLPIDLPRRDRFLAQLLSRLFAVGKLPNRLEHHPMRRAVPSLRETLDALSRLRVDLQRGRAKLSGSHGVSHAAIIPSDTSPFTTREVDDDLHGRPVSQALRTPLASTTGIEGRRFRIRSIAARLRVLRSARATASRMSSAMTALLFWPAKASLSACLTSSGTLKLTVDPDPLVEDFNNATVTGAPIVSRRERRLQ